MEKVAIIGIDLAKRAFQVHAGSKDGRPVLRLGTAGVVLLAAHKRLNVNRWNEPHVVPETATGPPPIVRRRACFHRHDGGRLFSQQAEQLRPRHLLALAGSNPRLGDAHVGEWRDVNASETFCTQPETRVDFLFFRLQRIEKSRFGRTKPRKSKQFCLVLFGFVWTEFALWL